MRTASYRVATVALILFAALFGTRAAADAATVSSFQTPVVGISNVVTLIYPPPDPVFVTYPTAVTGEQPDITTFSLAAPHAITISWRNLDTGAAGVVDVSAVPVDVRTGSGRIVATATTTPNTLETTVVAGFGTFIA